ncbi:tetratricopeptide repeat protein [Acuticoccus sp. M5D2P5]|uniref:cytochrome c3 family protein n=1 Tax=Acuticoccus kalidii TaxID=2910977 RepID=UPI001F34328C|nr:cytochrome c3 family protein [Acuticoccus kalidii]MCF3932101.1 tetratricopeptide repeat protein [Acuticoccus kalidii]
MQFALAPLVRRLSMIVALLAAPAAAQDATAPAYVGSQACATCHEEVAATWAPSHHARAWTPPSPETIVADFDGTRFDDATMSARFRIDPDGRFFVTVTEADGSVRDYPVHSVAGIEPLQQYLLETEPGRLQSFDVVWDTERGGWFHLYPDQGLAPGNAFHWTGPYKTWNARCAVCHATGYEANYDAQTETYASRQAEIGVGCEACHGPGEAHIAWTKGTAPPAGTNPFGLTAGRITKDLDATIDMCGGCHSRRHAFDDASPLPGTPYGDAYGLSLLEPGLYHADGQILDEVYVLGSLLQSKMAAKGVTCVDCHDPHSARLRASGNAVCTQCHNEAGNPAFPTLRLADYDSPAHHFHTPDTAGAACKNCHMVEHVYMGNDWRADHSFRIPRPDLAAMTGAPDACTTCHQDRDAAWAAAEIAARYPDPRNRGPHYGTTLAAGRFDPIAAAADLRALIGDDAAPAIVRATALDMLGQVADATLAEDLARYLDADDPLIRRAAVPAQERAPPTDGVPRLLSLLADPLRSVRVETARALLGAPIARLPQVASANLGRAMGEWRAMLAAHLDFPETHLQLAGMAFAMRNIPAAQAALQKAVEMDPQRVDAWSMLVRIAAATEGTQAAMAVLAEAERHNPGDPSLAALRGR